MNDQKTGEELVSVMQVAADTGVRPNSVRSWARHADAMIMKDGKAYLRHADAAEYARQHRAPSERTRKKQERTTAIAGRITVSAAACALGMTRQNLFNHLARGRIKAEQVGGGYYVDLDAVRRALGR